YELASPHGGVPQGQRSRAKYSRSGPCIAAKAGHSCPLGGTTGHSAMSAQCPVCPTADMAGRTAAIFAPADYAHWPRGIEHKAKARKFERCATLRSIDSVL